MPNHIKNRLKIIGTNKQIREVFEKHNTHVDASLKTAHDGTAICKNKSASEPKFGWLDLKTGIFTTHGGALEKTGLPENWIIEISQPVDIFPDFDKIIPHPRCDEYDDIPDQKSARDHPNWWMTWNRANWGTKWNSYSHSKGDYGTYYFETAWSGVPELMKIMSKQNPEVEFEYIYADEDRGYNVGSFKFKNGLETDSYNPEGGTKEAYDIYFELNPENKQQYKFVDGKYHYIEDSK